LRDPIRRCRFAAALTKRPAGTHIVAIFYWFSGKEFYQKARKNLLLDYLCGPLESRRANTDASTNLIGLFSNKFIDTEGRKG